MPPCKFTDFLWSNLLDSIQCFGKVGILQARYLHKNPGICQRECRFITTAHVSQHIVLHHGKLSIGSQLVLKAVYFMINLTDKRLHKFVGGFGTDRQHSLPRIGHDGCGDTVCVSFIFPDIGHQATAKITPEQCDQYAGLQVVRMITVQGKHAHTDGTLQGVRTFDEDTFSGGGNRMEFCLLRFTEIRTESLAAKQGLYPVDAITGYLTREIDAAIIGMIVTVIKLA